MKKYNKQFYTKEDIRTILTLWDTKTVQEIADELGRKKSSIQAMVKKIRECGYNLPKKMKHGTVCLMIKEVLTDMRLIK